MARSYFARYWAKTGTLIGGVSRSQTSRFQRRADAQKRLDDTIAINGGNCEGEILGSDLHPEIFSHCAGSIPQAIGGRCFRCGKLLTVEDAKAATELS